MGESDPDELINFYGKNESYTEIGKMLQEKLYDVLVEQELPLLEKNNVLSWSQPTCIDSEDAIPTLTHKVCSDLKEEEIYNHVCIESLVQQHCPRSCNVCCMDSIGQVLYYDNTFKNCTELNEADC